MGQDTNDLLLSDIRTGGMFPAASLVTFQDTDLLRLADREMQMGIVPLIMGVREKYFVTTLSVTIQVNTQTSVIRIPYRAIGGKLASIDLVALGSPQSIQHLAELSESDREASVAGYWIENDLITLSNPAGNWSSSTAELHYYQRPNRLVATSACGTITNINTGTNTVTVGAIPGSFQTGLTYDLIRAKPSYATYAIDQTGTVAGSTVQLSSLPSELAAGDYVALSEESPVAQIPPEFHPVLAQRVIVKVLEAVGDAMGMQAAQAKLSELQANALTLITPRVDGTQKRFANRQSPFRRQRRWLLY